MTPRLNDGEIVWVLLRQWLRKPLKKGDLIVFHEKMHGTLVKEVESLSSDGSQVKVRGLHEFSTDSRLFGPIPFSQIVGKVIFK